VAGWEEVKAARQSPPIFTGRLSKPLKTEAVYLFMGKIKDMRPAQSF
jgi:hypothetical protein